MGEIKETGVPRPKDFKEKSEGTVKLQKVDNGWMLIFDNNGDFEKDGVPPYIIVKEGTSDFNGLLDEFLDTFLLTEVWGYDKLHDNQEFEISLVVKRIK
jgi:hypothetical protein